MHVSVCVCVSSLFIVSAVCCMWFVSETVWKGGSFCETWLKLCGVISEGEKKSPAVRGRPISVWPFVLHLQTLQKSACFLTVRQMVQGWHQTISTHHRLQWASKFDYFQLHTIFRCLSSLLLHTHHLCKTLLLLSSHICVFVHILMTALFSSLSLTHLSDHSRICSFSRKPLSDHLNLNPSPLF